MAGLLDLAFMQGMPQGQPTAAAGPVPPNPQPQMPQMPNIPPELLAALSAKLTGQAPQAAPPAMTGPGLGLASAPGDQMAAAAGALPQSGLMSMIAGIAKKRAALNPDPTDPGYVRSMKSLLDRGAITEQQYAKMIDDPRQFAHGGSE